MKILSKPALKIVGIFALVAVAYYIGTQAPKTNIAIGADADLKVAVKDVLIENPAIIIAAFENLKQHQEKVAQQAVEKELTPFLSSLKTDKNIVVAGNPNGDVTMVEFFDYQCGYCKRVVNDLVNVVEADGNIRLVLIDMPILGDGSKLAAQYALAAEKQGKYMEFHTALMKSKGRLNDTMILDIAKAVGGLDIEKLKADKDSEAIAARLDSNVQQARKLNINGTPAFIIGQEVAPGAITGQRMKEMVARARKNS